MQHAAPSLDPMQHVPGVSASASGCASQVLTHLDLFSGMGGFGVAARAAGFQTIAFCEYDETCRTFLKSTWGVECHPDIRKLDATGYRGRLSLLTGGPPCQPASRAGDQRGAEDDRWLWPEALRVLDEARPTWFVLENPLGIGDVGLDGILAEMGRLGYETETFDIPACAVDSPQLRNRYWIVGHAKSEPGPVLQWEQGGRKVYDARGASRNLAHPTIAGCEGPDAECREAGCGAECHHGNHRLADAENLHGGGEQQPGEQAEDGRAGSPRSDWQSFVWVPCADGKVRRAPDESIDVVDGLSRELLKALGNSIVPQVASEILFAIYEVQTASEVKHNDLGVPAAAGGTDTKPKP